MSGIGNPKMAKKVFTFPLSEPLGGAASASVDIHTVDGNLRIDALPGGPELASGDLQYLENQEPPTRSVIMNGEHAAFSIKSSSKGQSWIRLPWAACNGATEWQVHLNPTIPLDITAHSGGGNVWLDLTGMTITRLTADTGGGNMEVILPDHLVDVHVTVKSGAGNVTIQIPGGMAARIQATTGLGKVILDGPFNQIDKLTYQSPDYNRAVQKVEITASSGAGNVSIKEKTAHPEMTAIPS
jgi:Cell wall-active antibiotics response LiaF, C-terminal